MNFRPLPAVLPLCAALLGGCLSAPDKGGSCASVAASVESGSGRVLKGDTYVDPKFGFCLDIPGSWQAAVDGAQDLETGNSSGSLYVYINHTPLESPRTLRQIVEDTGRTAPPTPS